MNAFLSDPVAIAVGLLGVLMSVLSWLGRRQVQRLDVIEKQHVARSTLDQTLSAMRTERREMHIENRDALSDIATKVDDIRERVGTPLAVLIQRVDTLEERVDELKDFKHDHCEPACRYVDYLKTEKPWERK